MGTEDRPEEREAGKPYPVIHVLECKACGRCIEACPKDLLAMSEEFNERGYNYAVYRGEGCTGCGNCFYTCPEPGAIEVHIPARKKRAAKDVEGA